MDRCEILEFETRGCFNFFWNEIGSNKNFFGLVKDSTSNFETHKNVSSIASTGFALVAIVIGVSRGYVSEEDGYERVSTTLKNIYENIKHTYGFFNHFINMDTGETAWDSEVSIIDTSIFLMGAMVASEYFKGLAQKYFEKIYERVDWEFFRNKNTNRFYMGYNDREGKHFGEWDSYAEQLMMYFLGVSSPTHPINKEMFYNFNRDKIKVHDKEFMFSPFGSLFTHQYSHGFINFKNKKDRTGFDFFENSKLAAFLNREFCINNKCKSYGENSWGITPCETHEGYIGSLGVPPSLNLYFENGTIGIYGAIASIVFTPNESIDFMNFIFENYKEQLWGGYGFKDSYNLNKNWFCNYEIGIDKGISIVMIENYRSELIWDLIMGNKYILKAFSLLEFC